MGSWELLVGRGLVTQRLHTGGEGKGVGQKNLGEVPHLGRLFLGERFVFFVSGLVPVQSDDMRPIAHVGGDQVFFSQGVDSAFKRKLPEVDPLWGQFRRCPLEDFTEHHPRTCPVLPPDVVLGFHKIACDTVWNILWGQRPGVGGDYSRHLEYIFGGVPFAFGRGFFVPTSRNN